jgi:hypothetical protein
MSILRKIQKEKKTDMFEMMCKKKSSLVLCIEKRVEKDVKGMRECYAVGCLFFAIIHFGGLLIRPQG